MNRLFASLVLAALSASSHAAPACAAGSLSMNFPDMPLSVALQVVADFAGHKLVTDPGISGRGSFRHDCVPWQTALNDIAARHALAVQVDSKTIRVSRK